MKYKKLIKGDIYKLQRKDYLICLAEYLSIAFLLSYLFYDSLYAFLVFIIFFPVYLKRYKERAASSKQNQLKDDFIKLLQGMSTSLSAGLSVENSLREAKKELVNLSENGDSLLIGEVNNILLKIENGSRLEDELSDFATRCEIDEIRDFATIFRVANRSGGRFTEVFLNCVSIMKSKQDTQKEIQILISGKRYEQKIMNIMPFALILGLRFTSKELLQKLYHNLPGIIIMTILLLIYVAAILLSEKISDIRC